MSSFVKSFSFPSGDIRGDTFYIKHGSDSFTVIDCYLLADSANVKNNRQKEIIDEIISESSNRIRRFISTHPDHDHIAGIDELFRRWPTKNFYAVENSIPPDKNDPSLTYYLELKKNYNCAISRGITRCWLNSNNDEHSGSGIHFQWPILSNSSFIEALEKVAKGEDVNNICPVFTYSIRGGATFMWMGDLETKMQEEFYYATKGSIPKVDILFQPHHGRFSGAVPDELFQELNPKLVIIGNAPSDHIDYGDTRMTITQNFSGDLLFENESEYVHIYSQHKIPNPPSCLTQQPLRSIALYDKTPYYCGSLKV